MLKIFEIVKNLETFRQKELAAALALQFIPGIGPARMKKLALEKGNILNLFEENKFKQVLAILKNSVIPENQIADLIERELEFVHKFNIDFYLWPESSYPTRLKKIPDAPYILFSKGKSPIEKERHLAIVGTRKASEKGKQFVRELVMALAPFDPLVISGLALGIDTAAHQAALEAGLATAAILGHGMDRIYPHTNRNLASSILSCGYLATEFPSGTKPDKQNFPKRNRIVAGLSDAVVVVETGMKGGAMITARLACTYNKDVFAVPGRPWDIQAEGCNNLIKTNIAQLVTNPEDVALALGWHLLFKEEKISRAEITLNFTPEESEIIKFLNEKGTCHLEELSAFSTQAPATLAATLLSLELTGVVRSLPGRMYELI